MKDCKIEINDEKLEKVSSGTDESIKTDYPFDSERERVINSGKRNEDSVLQSASGTLFRNQ